MNMFTLHNIYIILLFFDRGGPFSADRVISPRVSKGAGDQPDQVPNDRTLLDNYDKLPSVPKSYPLSPVTSSDQAHGDIDTVPRYRIPETLSSYHPDTEQHVDFRLPEKTFPSYSDTERRTKVEGQGLTSGLLNRGQTFTKVTEDCVAKPELKLLTPADFMVQHGSTSDLDLSPLSTPRSLESGRSDLDMQHDLESVDSEVSIDRQIISIRNRLKEFEKQKRKLR